MSPKGGCGQKLVIKLASLATNLAQLWYCIFYILSKA